MTVAISDIVREVFEDMETHQLQDIYVHVSKVLKKEGVELDMGRIQHRVRSRINGFYKAGVIDRESPSTYRLVDRS